MNLYSAHFSRRSTRKSPSRLRPDGLKRRPIPNPVASCVNKLDTSTQMSLLANHFVVATTEGAGSGADGCNRLATSRGKMEVGYYGERLLVDGRNRNSAIECSGRCENIPSSASTMRSSWASVGRPAINPSILLNTLLQ